MSRRITATIGVRRLLQSAQANAHGNKSRRHADPVPMDVYAIYPTSSEEPAERGATPVVTGRTVLAPITAEGKIGAHDLVDLPDGDTYRVDGKPAPWKKNPHTRGRHEGLQIQLVLTEG